MAKLLSRMKDGILLDFHRFDEYRCALNELWVGGVSLESFEQQLAQAAKKLASLEDLSELKRWHHEVLSKHGFLSRAKKDIGKAAVHERPILGSRINEAAQVLEAAFFAKQDHLQNEHIDRQVAEEACDMTLPGRAWPLGRKHLVTSMLDDILQVFSSLGFSVLRTRHVETDAFNFQYLNIPEDHPARDMQDTFFVDSHTVLRTHTSPGQIHAMRRAAPRSLAVALPGMCYRNEDVTPRSEIQFHQVEGLVVHPEANFSHLKAILLHLAQSLFGSQQKVRLRASYFPFTEPSVEVDMLCTLCNGEGCRVCKHTGWLEFVGAGMVHPEVLRAGGYDPQIIQGFALGLGVERLCMLRHHMSDIRDFFANSAVPVL